MHAHLPSIHNQHTIAHTRDVGRAIDVPRHDEAALHVVDHEAGERMWLAAGGAPACDCRGDRHVQHTAVKVGNPACGGSAGSGRWKQDVHVAVGADVDVTGAAEGGLADAGAVVRGEFFVVVLAGREGGEGAQTVLLLGGGRCGGPGGGVFIVAGIEMSALAVAADGQGGEEGFFGGG